MKDKLVISLNNVRLYGHHGVASQETIVGAEYVLSLRVSMPKPRGCYTDDVADTVSYADIFSMVQEEFLRPSRLIEHLATRIGERVLNSFKQLETVEIEVVKVSPPIPGFSGSASVSLFFEKNRL